MQLVRFCQNRSATAAELDVVRRYGDMASDLADLRQLGARVLECFEHRQPRDPALGRALAAVWDVLEQARRSRFLERDLRRSLGGWRPDVWDAQPSAARHVGPLRLNSLHTNGYTSRDLDVVRSFFDVCDAWGVRHAGHAGAATRRVVGRCRAACIRGVQGLDHCHPTLAEAPPGRPGSPPDPDIVAAAIEDAVETCSDRAVAAAAWQQLREDVRFARGAPFQPAIPCLWLETEGAWVGVLHGSRVANVVLARAAVLQDARLPQAKRSVLYVADVLLPAYARASLAATPGFVPDRLQLV